MEPLDLLADEDPVPQRSKGKQKATTDADFTINSTFATKYEQKKRGEELSKLRDKYGSDYGESEDDSEDFSSEDSDAEFVTPAVDAAILRTISRIKRGDPSIYGSESIFDAEEKLHAAARNLSARDGSKSKSKPVLLKDFQRTALMATLGGDKEEAVPGPTPADEAAQLQAETRRAFLGLDDETGENADADEALLVPREQTKGEAQAEEEEYAAFLRQHVGDTDIEEALRRSEAEAAGTGDTDDGFLRNYILGRGWMDKNAKKVPKYDDIVEERDEPSRAGPTGANAYMLDTTLDDEDALHEEKVDAFESKYNFRFEDEGGESLVTHARDVGASARRKDDSRKQAREAVKSRKVEEKQAKVAELERLKELKKNEIVEKLARIKKNTGDQDLDLDGFNFDSDFDPDEHDRRMLHAFDEGYYGREDADGKPVWDDDIDIGDIEVEADALPSMDADFEPGGEAYDPLAPESKASKRQKQREKKKNKKRKTVDDALGDPDQATDLDPEEEKAQLGRALEEYKKLDFEDIVGDIPTRFKYAKVDPDAFELTPAEILMATDAELNDVLGLRKIAPYRKDGSKKATIKRKKLQELRERLASRKWGQDVDEDEAMPRKSAKRAKTASGREAATNGAKAAPTKRKGKKERQRAKAQAEPGVVGADNTG